MFGPRSHRPQETHHRDRRRIVIAVVIIVVVAIVLGEVIDDLVKSSPPTARRTEATWVSAVGGVIAEANTLSPALHAVRSHATNPSFYDRVTLNLALGNLERASSQELTSFETLGLEAPSSETGVLVGDVLTWRADGFVRLARGVELALDGNPSAGVAIAVAGARFVAADAAYARAVKLLDRRGDKAALPSSSWITSASLWSASSSANWARALGSAPNLTAAPSLSIVALSLEPPPLRITGLPTPPTPTSPASTTSTTTSSPTTTVPGQTTTTTSTTTTSTIPAPTTTSQIPPSGSVSIVAATKDVRVIVVIEDTGNTEIRGAHVVAALDLTGKTSASKARSSVQREVPSLAPGASAYLVLPKLAVARASTYNLFVTATLGDGRSVRRSVKLEVGN